VECITKRHKYPLPCCHGGLDRVVHSDEGRLMNVTHKLCTV
jgi:hypothetical protein